MDSDIFGDKLVQKLKKIGYREEMKLYRSLKDKKKCTEVTSADLNASSLSKVEELVAVKVQ